MEINDTITLRDYFAAHAPQTMPNWFVEEFDSQYKPPPKRPKNAEFCNGCKGGGDCEDTMACRLAQAHREAVKAWKNNQNRDRQFGWAWFWADEMLKAR